MTEGNKKYKRKVLKIDYDNNDYPFALEVNFGTWM